MCAGPCLRRSWSTGGWTVTRWSPAAGWPTPSTGTPRRPSLSSTRWTSTPRSPVMRRLQRGSDTRMTSTMGPSVGGRELNPRFGWCLMNPTRPLLPRSLESSQSSSSASRSCHFVWRPILTCGSRWSGTSRSWQGPMWPPGHLTSTAPTLMMLSSILNVFVTRGSPSRSLSGM